MEARLDREMGKHEERMDRIEARQGEVRERVFRLPPQLLLDRVTIIEQSVISIDERLTDLDRHIKALAYPDLKRE